jgi:NDP-sugar pyrophosphorylase family protein
MKVVILCGGEGTRMREETEFKPKPLVEVGGKPILWHIMKIYAHYGYNDFIVALGYKGNMIKEYFLNWRTFVNDFTLETKGHELKFHKNGHDDFKITFVDTGLKSLTGERVRRLKDYITDDEFMLTYGDGVGDVNIPELLEFHHKQNTIGTITGVNPAARYGMIEIDELTDEDGEIELLILELGETEADGEIEELTELLGDTEELGEMELLIEDDGDTEDEGDTEELGEIDGDPPKVVLQKSDDNVVVPC